MNVSRSGYYSYLKRALSKREVENIELEEEIESIYKEHRGLYGSPRIHAILKHNGYFCSRKRVAKLMKKKCLRAKMNKSFQKRKKFKGKGNPNLLKRNFKIDQPNKIWVSDISYIKTTQGFVYLAAVMDLFSRKVIGWKVEDHMRADLVEEALTSALFKRKPNQLIHHSDRGKQYTSDCFQKMSEKNGITLSMNDKGCYDNAVIESFFHTLKTELIYLTRFESKQEVQSALFEYIEVFYNRQRIHSTLEYTSPEAFENNYREKQMLCS